MDIHSAAAEKIVTAIADDIEAKMASFAAAFGQGPFRVGPVTRAAWKSVAVDVLAGAGALGHESKKGGT